MILVISLMLVAIAASSGENIRYGEREKSIELQAQDGCQDKVESIIWKHEENKAGEWFDGDDAITYFRIFIGTAEINTKTCSLNISNLQPHFNGKYSAEVNNQNPKSSITLHVIGPVTTAEIVDDENCKSPGSKNCTLTCKGTGEGPLEYFWTSSQGQESNNQELTVPKEEKSIIFTCNVSSPVSWKEATYQVPSDTANMSNKDGIIGGIIVAIVAATGAGIVVVLKKKGLIKFPGQGEAINSVPGDPTSAEGVGFLESKEAERKAGSSANRVTGNNSSNNNRVMTGGADYQTKDETKPIANVSAGNGVNDNMTEKTGEEGNNTESKPTPTADDTAANGEDDDNKPETGRGDGKTENNPNPTADGSAANGEDGSNKEETGGGEKVNEGGEVQGHLG